MLISTLLYPVGIEHESSNECFDLDKRRDLFNLARDAIINLGLEKVWDVHSLLEGNNIKNTLHLNDGRLVGDWKQKTMEWQLAHPSGTADECLERLKEAGADTKRSKFQ